VLIGESQSRLDPILSDKSANQPDLTLFLNFGVKSLWKRGIFTPHQHYDTVFKQGMHSLFLFESLEIPSPCFFRVGLISPANGFYTAFNIPIL